MRSSRRPSRFFSTTAVATLALAGLAIVGVILARPAHAGFPWFKKGHRAAPCPPPVPGVGEGEWYWMRSPEQEQQVVAGLYARYCIRCHGATKPKGDVRLDKNVSDKQSMFARFSYKNRQVITAPSSLCTYTYCAEAGSPLQVKLNCWLKPPTAATVNVAIPL